MLVCAARSSAASGPFRIQCDYLPPSLSFSPRRIDPSSFFSKAVRSSRVKLPSSLPMQRLSVSTPYNSTAYAGFFFPSCRRPSSSTSRAFPDLDPMNLHCRKAINERFSFPVFPSSETCPPFRLPDARFTTDGPQRSLATTLRSPFLLRSSFPQTNGTTSPFLSTMSQTFQRPLRSLSLALFPLPSVSLSFLQSAQPFFVSAQDHYIPYQHVLPRTALLPLPETNLFPPRTLQSASASVLALAFDTSRTSEFLVTSKRPLCKTKKPSSPP